MLIPVLFLALYGAALLPMLLLSFARVGKTEIWVLTSLTLVWLAGVGVFYSFIFKAGMASGAGPLILAGICGALCIIWAIILSYCKEEPNQSSQPTPSGRG